MVDACFNIRKKNIFHYFIYKYFFNILSLINLDSIIMFTKYHIWAQNIR